MTEPLNKPVFVFDLDGTLVDSMGGFAEMAADVIGHYFQKPKEWALKAYRQTSGLPFPFQLEALFPGNVLNAQAVADFDRRKAMTYESRPFFEDVMPVLIKLKAMDRILAVSSNNDHENVLKKLGAYVSLFDMVCGYRPRFLKGKDHFEAIAIETGYGLDQMLFVGDSLHDAAMASDNGISFAARVGTFSTQAFVDAGHKPFFILTLNDILSQLTHHDILDASRDSGRRPGNAA